MQDLRMVAALNPKVDSLCNVNGETPSYCSFLMPFPLCCASVPSDKDLQWRKPPQTEHLGYHVADSGLGSWVRLGESPPQECPWNPAASQAGLSGSSLSVSSFWTIPMWFYSLSTLGFAKPSCLKSSFSSWFPIASFSFSHLRIRDKDTHLYKSRNKTPSLLLSKETQWFSQHGEAETLPNGLRFSAVVQPHQFSLIAEAITPGLLVIKHTAPRHLSHGKEGDSGNSENMSSHPRAKPMAFILVTPWDYVGVSSVSVCFVWGETSWLHGLRCESSCVVEHMVQLCKGWEPLAFWWKASGSPQRRLALSHLLPDLGL